MHTQEKLTILEEEKCIKTYQKELLKLALACRTRALSEKIFNIIFSYLPVNNLYILDEKSTSSPYLSKKMAYLQSVESTQIKSLISIAKKHNQSPLFIKMKMVIVLFPLMQNVY